MWDMMQKTGFVSMKKVYVFLPTCERKFPVPGGHIRSFALFTRLSPSELQLQSKSHLPGGRVDQDEEIQVAIGDSEKGVGSGCSQAGDD